jgi:histidine ammonia-lyase
MAAPALDDLAGIWADVCLLADRHCGKLLNGQVSHLPDHLLVGRQPGQSDGRGNVGYVPMAANGYVELAKAAAQRTFIPGSDSLGSGQDDVATPCFIAWSKEARAARCLDASLGMLAVIAAQALFVTDRTPPLPLGKFVQLVRKYVAPVVEDRVLGPELGHLADAITANIFGPDDRIDSASA